MTPQVQTLPAIGALAGHWDQLAREAPGAPPFVRSFWVDSAAPSEHRLVAAVFDGDELIGGMAFERERRPGYELLRAAGFRLSPDHVDVVAAPGRVLAVVDALHAWFRRPGNRVVELVGVDDDARILGALPGRVDMQWLGPDRRLELPTTYDAYLRDRSRSFRSTTARAEKRLVAAGVHYRRVPSDTAPEALDALVRLHARRFGPGESMLVPYAASFTRTMQAGVDRGDVVLFEALRGSDRLAVDAWGVSARCWTAIQGGRDPERRWRGLGRQLFLFAIRSAIETGVKEVDMLRGLDEWKLSVATRTHDLYTARAYSRPRWELPHRLFTRIEFERWRRREGRRRVSVGESDS